MGALLQLARQVLARVLGGTGRRAIAGGATGALGAEALTGGGLPGFFGRAIGLGDGADGPRRRRRRKALTDSDIRIALTIANAISKKAAENFILQRVRSS